MDSFFISVHLLLLFPWNNYDIKPLFLKCEIHINLRLLYFLNIIKLPIGQMCQVQKRQR